MKIICTLPNASMKISGIRFEMKEGKRVSVDDVPENMLPIFLSIEGYAEFPEQTGDDSGGADDGDPDDPDKGGQDEPSPWEDEPGETVKETPSNTADDESGAIEKDDSGETPQTPEGNASGSRRGRKR